MTLGLVYEWPVVMRTCMLGKSYSVQWGEFIFDRVSYVYSLLFTIYFFNLSLSVSVRLSRNFSLIFRENAVA